MKELASRNTEHKWGDEKGEH